MKIEIICQGKSDVFVCPPETDFVGISIDDVCNINTGFPEALGGAPVHCKKKQQILPNGTPLTVYLYELSGNAKVLSLKEYAGLVCYDISYEEIQVIATV